MSLVPEYTEARDVFCKFRNGDEEPFTAFIQNARESAQKRLALLSVLADNVYLVSRHRELKDTEKEQTKRIVEMLKDFPEPIVNLVSCLCLETNFDGDVGGFDADLMSVIVHVTCITVADCGDKDGASLLMKALLDPKSLKHVYIPSSQDEQPPNTSTEVRTSFFECSCLTKIATNGDTCPVCDKMLTDNLQASLTTHEPASPVTEKRGFLPAVSTSWYPRKMTSGSFAVLRFLLNTCIVSGRAILKHDLAETIGELSSEDVLKTCLKELKQMWELLKTWLNLPPHKMCCLMHGILHRMRLLLTNKNCKFESAAQRAEWETIFANEVEDLITQRHVVAQKTMRATAFGPDSFESEIDELVTTDNELAKNRLSHLFRFTPLKTTYRLHGEYKLSSSEKKHPFLAMFFSCGQDLAVLQYLNIILKWQRLITHSLGHHVIRDDAEQKIKQIISSDATMRKDKEKLKLAFDEFIEAWNKIRPFVKALTRRNNTFEEMPILHHDSMMKDCIAVDTNSVLYKVVGALADMQNTFMERALSIAVTGNCIALSFLQRDAAIAAIPIIPVHEVKSEQVIECTWDQWKDDIMQFSQFNTHYGMGYDLEFDFTGIEMELANRLVLGKVHLLLNDSFPFFAFAHELPLRSNDLANLKKAVPQDPLPESVLLHLKDMNDQNPGNTTVLKLHLDIILNMLQRPREVAESPNKPVVDYANAWYEALGKEFPSDLLPQPSTTVKLCHFVELYETTEDLLCLSAEDKLPDKFRQKLDETINEEMMTLLKNTTVDLTKLAKLLRRFVFRVFSGSEDRIPDPTNSLFVLLERHLPSSVDDEGQAYLDGVAPLFGRHVMVSHVYEVVKNLEKASKAKTKPRIELSAVDTRTASTPVSKRTRTRGRATRRT